MNTLKVKAVISNKKLLWSLPYIIVLVGLLISFIDFSEFYTVAIKAETGSYPWGPVNEVPWYYQTPATYSTYVVISGLLFLTATSLTLWATLKKKRKSVVAGVGLIVILLLAHLISASIQ